MRTRNASERRRYEAILKAREEGMSLNRIAHKFGVTKQRISWLLLHPSKE